MLTPALIGDVQELLAQANYYEGEPSWIMDDQTRHGIRVVLDNLGRPEVFDWSEERRAIAAMQRILDAQGYEPGPIDGYRGQNTDFAREAWRNDREGRPQPVIDRTPIANPVSRDDLPRQKDCPAYYGDPAKGEVEPNVHRFTLPFAMRLDWALDQTVSRIRLHRRAGPSFVAALEDVEEHYGLARVRELGIDRFAGSYVHRKMRGGTSWSMHAYGCAVDIYAQPNGLRTRCPQALFCKPEYQPFLDIMERHGWLCGGRLWGADFMHLQKARL